MNWLLLAPGLLVGGGLAVLVAVLVPALPNASDALANLSGARRSTVGVQTRQDRIGLWVNARTNRLPLLERIAAPAKDLAITGTVPSVLYFRKALWAMVGLLAPAFIGVAQLLLGTGTTLFPGVVAIAGGILGWIAPDLAVRSKAKEVRESYARTVAVYLELVAAGLKRRQTVDAALERAASISNSYPMRQIRRHLTEARLNAEKPWDALEQLCHEIDVPALGDVARIAALSGEQGGSIYSTLMNRGKQLRLELLKNQEAAEKKRSENLTFPQLGAAFLAILIGVVPMILSIANQAQGIFPAGGIP